MCLAIPGRVLEVYRERDLSMGKVAFGPVARPVCLEHTPDARPGDYVLVHVGFALARLDEEEAKQIFEMLSALGGFDDSGSAEDP